MCAQKVQLIINLCLALASIGLLIVTLIYTFATRKMADEMKRQSAIMQREFEFRIAPLIEPNIIKKTTGVIDPELGISVVNKGFYPVKFQYIFFRWWHREKPDTVETDIIQIWKWLEKGEQKTYEKKIDFSKIAQFRNASDVKGNGIVSVELHFEDLSKNQFTLLKDKVIIYLE